MCHKFFKSINFRLFKLLISWLIFFLFAKVNEDFRSENKCIGFLWNWRKKHYRYSSETTMKVHNMVSFFVVMKTNEIFGVLIWWQFRSYSAISYAQQRAFGICFEIILVFDPRHYDDRNGDGKFESCVRNHITLNSLSWYGIWKLLETHFILGILHFCYTYTNEKKKPNTNRTIYIVEHVWCSVCNVWQCSNSWRRKHQNHCSKRSSWPKVLSKRHHHHN